MISIITNFLLILTAK